MGKPETDERIDRAVGLLTAQDAVTVSSEAEQLVAALVRELPDAEAIGELFVRLYSRAQLSEAALGSLVGVTTLERDAEIADQVLWHGLVQGPLELVSDFLDLVQEDELTALCGSFLCGRLQGLDDDDDAVREAAALSQVFCLRLTGFPLVYGYLDRDDFLRFAGAMVRYAVDGLAARRLPPEKLRSAEGRLAQGMARLVAQEVFTRNCLLSVPRRVPADAQTDWDPVPCRDGEDHLFLYPERQE